MVAKDVLFLQNSAPAHKSHFAINNFCDLGLKPVDHPPYSAGLAPSDHYLYLLDCKLLNQLEKSALADRRTLFDKTQLSVSQNCNI